MTVSHACILLACLLPIACAGIAKSRGFGKPRREGGYDNHNPRAWLEQLQGFQARANAAQYNSFEALPVFIAGVLIAEHGGAAQATVDALAVAFILCRLGYIGAYVTDRANLRSLLWLLGLACCVVLFFLGA
ncbi:MAG: MAPEG family protein [Betaproteobacteria bacterium]